MRVFAIPILRNHWAYYCHSNIQSTSRLARAVDWSSKKWDQLGSAEPNTWKRKLYDGGTRLMNQLDYQEWFLKNVPTKEDIKDNESKVREKLENNGNLAIKPVHVNIRWRFTCVSPVYWMHQISSKILRSSWRNENHITKSTCTIRHIGFLYPARSSLCRSFRIYHLHTTSFDGTATTKVYMYPLSGRNNALCVCTNVFIVKSI